MRYNFKNYFFLLCRVLCEHKFRPEIEEGQPLYERLKWQEKYDSNSWRRKYLCNWLKQCPIQISICILYVCCLNWRQNFPICLTRYAGHVNDIAMYIHTYVYQQSYTYVYSVKSRVAQTPIIVYIYYCLYVHIFFRGSGAYQLWRTHNLPTHPPFNLRSPVVAYNVL